MTTFIGDVLLGQTNTSLSRLEMCSEAGVVFILGLVNDLSQESFGQIVLRLDNTLWGLNISAFFSLFSRLLFSLFELRSRTCQVCATVEQQERSLACKFCAETEIRKQIVLVERVTTLIWRSTN